MCSNNTHWLHAHFAGELRFASCLLLLPLLQTCASCDQNFSHPPQQHTPTRPSQSDFFYHRRCTMSDQISIIFTFYVSKPFESAFPNCQNDWLVLIPNILRARHFSFCLSRKTAHPSDHIHFRPVQLYHTSTLILLSYIRRLLKQYACCEASVLTRILYQLKQPE